jgi:hypothetical protein
VSILSAAAIAVSPACASSMRSAPVMHADPWTGAIGAVTGREVEVRLFNGTRVAGTLVEVTDDGLTIRTGPMSVERRERPAVRQVTLLQRGRDSLRNGALIGATVGAGYAVGVISYYKNGDDGLRLTDSAAMIATAAGIGAGIGAIADLLRQGTSRRTIYAAAAPRP